jgi:hypothetical protein
MDKIWADTLQVSESHTSIMPRVHFEFKKK